MIEVGRGRVPGDQFIMMFSEPDGHSVHSVSFSTGPEGQSEWELLTYDSRF